VFSQFTGFLRGVEAALARAGLHTAYLDGSTTDRQAVVDGFRQGDAVAFLISLKAGGFGLTLTEADYVFVLDPWWNPAAESQAIDRAHRIGQDRPVTVYRLVSTGTIEEKVVALQERKRDLFHRVVDDGGSLSGAITSDDVRDLLGLG
jgi:SNF2 family DNA or RNA helicase